MKKVLIFLATSLCISLTMSTQTIISTVPASVDVGSDLSISYTYTNPDAGVVFIAVELYDGDTYVSGVAQYKLEPAPAKSGTDSSTAILSIPSSTTPTADLTGTQNYKVLVKLVDSSWGDLGAEHRKDIELTGTVTPALLFVGDDTSWDFEPLTWVINRKFTKTVMLTNGNIFNFYETDKWEGAYRYNYFTSVHSDLTDAGDNDNNFRFTGATGNYTITVDLTAKTVGLESTATAGLEDINVDGLVMYPNPVSDILRIKNTGVSEIMSFQIIDILGRIVYKNNDKKVNSIDVSNLSKGLYFLTTNTNRQFKFLKK